MVRKLFISLRSTYISLQKKTKKTRTSCRNHNSLLTLTLMPAERYAINYNYSNNPLYCHHSVLKGNTGIVKEHWLPLSLRIDCPGSKIVFIRPRSHPASRRLLAIETETENIVPLLFSKVVFSKFLLDIYRFHVKYARTFCVHIQYGSKSDISSWTFHSAHFAFVFVFERSSSMWRPNRKPTKASR